MQQLHQLLQERFGKPQQIITAHMDELLKVSPYLSDRPSQLRFAYDHICVHSSGLASLGVLLPEIRLQVARNTKDSINECLQKGPNLVPHLFHVVVNF